MVQGAWPIQRPEAKLAIPPFHLAFCLAALEHDPELCSDPVVRDAVLHSVSVWKANYHRSGLVVGMPGWYFVDWDPVDPATAGRTARRTNPYDVSAAWATAAHAVCNAWWSELCERVSPADASDPDAFDRAFWTGVGYTLTEGGRDVSPHATAAALCCEVARNHRAEALQYLDDAICGNEIRARVTPYFGYFVARALEKRSRANALAFVADFYGPIARAHGTLYERTAADASLAHGWSLGVAAFLSPEESRRP
jgi:hypothetical protein